MRSVFKYLLAITLSCALAIAISVIWWWSGRLAQLASFARGPGDVFLLMSDRGRLVVVHQTASPAEANGMRADVSNFNQLLVVGQDNLNQLELDRPLYRIGGSYDFNADTILLQNGQTVSFAFNQSAWGLPIWMLLAASLVPVVISTTLLVRRVNRFDVGACDECGYDLRATPDRCPECGRDATRAVAAS